MAKLFCKEEIFALETISYCASMQTSFQDATSIEKEEGQVRN
jgi:hypothetical protein